MGQLASLLAKKYPSITFVKGSRASWSAKTKVITYSSDNSQLETFALLHELGHALLGHADFNSDVDLLRKESAAWETARGLAAQYNVSLDDDHIQDCLDTYRDWLHKRSTCPVCKAHGVQKDSHSYTCINCSNNWRVTSNRLCRPYRLNQDDNI